MGNFADNAKLLDENGTWIESRDFDALEKYHGKIMVGFLGDSNYNVPGFMRRGKNANVSMVGYYCTHYRELTKSEVNSLTDYKTRRQD